MYHFHAPSMHAFLEMFKDLEDLTLGLDSQQLSVQHRHPQNLFMMEFTLQVVEVHEFKGPQHVTVFPKLLWQALDRCVKCGVERVVLSATDEKVHVEGQRGKGKVFAMSIALVEKEREEWESLFEYEKLVEVPSADLQTRLGLLEKKCEVTFEVAKGTLTLRQKTKVSEMEFLMEFGPSKPVRVTLGWSLVAWLRKIMDVRTNTRTTLGIEPNLPLLLQKEEKGVFLLRFYAAPQDPE